jgi:ketosteroid isomerase-like protein
MSKTIGSIRAWTLALCLCLAMVPAASGDTKADEALILERIHKACAAFEKGDVDYLVEFLDETFTLTDTRGQVTSREQNLAEVRKREPRYDVFRNHDMKVRVYGDSAVVTGITSIKGTSGGTAFAVDVRFTDTLLKRDGNWRMVASHASPLGSSAAAERAGWKGASAPSE